MILQWGCSQHLAMSVQDERVCSLAEKSGQFTDHEENVKCEAAALRIHIIPSCLINWRMNKPISHTNYVKSGLLCSKGSYISKVNQLTEKLIDFKFRPICSGNWSSLLFWHLKCLIDALLEVGWKSHDSTSVGGIQVQAQHVNKGRSKFQSETSAGSQSVHPLGIGWK